MSDPNRMPETDAITTGSENIIPFPYLGDVEENPSTRSWLQHRIADMLIDLTFSDSMIESVKNKIENLVNAAAERIALSAGVNDVEMLGPIQLSDTVSDMLNVRDLRRLRDAADTITDLSPLIGFNDGLDD